MPLSSILDLKKLGNVRKRSISHSRKGKPAYACLLQMLPIISLSKVFLVKGKGLVSGTITFLLQARTDMKMSVLGFLNFVLVKPEKMIVPPISSIYCYLSTWALDTVPTDAVREFVFQQGQLLPRHKLQKQNLIYFTSTVATSVERGRARGLKLNPKPLTRALGPGTHP